MVCIFNRALQSFSILVLFGLISITAQAGEDLLSLPDLTVAAEEDSASEEFRAEIAPLSYPPDLQLRSQGGAGRQIDLSVRGSGFSAVELSIEGVSLENPQTAHFNSELPLPLSIFAAPGVVTGVGQELLDDPALVGSVLLRFRALEEGGEIRVGGGDYGHNRQSLEYSGRLYRGDAGLAAGAGVFATRERSDGRDYEDNYLELDRAGGQMQMRSSDIQTDLVCAHQKKSFGARGYYGVSPDYFAEEDIEDTLVLASSRIGRGSDLDLRINAMWRELEDDYRLELPSGLYRNRHRTVVQKAGLTADQNISSVFDLAWGIDAGGEEIESESLGDHRREGLGLRLLPSATLGEFRLVSGVRLKSYRDLDPTWLPQFAAELSLSDLSHLYASYTRGSRQPSYTELNYESPGSLGNAGLEMQRSDNSEFGFRTRLGDHLRASLAGFHRSMDNAIDWVKYEPQGRWTAVNLGQLKTRGVEAEIEYRSSDDRRACRLDYRYTDKSDDDDYYAGRYLLDYARHYAGLRFSLRLGAGVSIFARQGLRAQVDNPIRRGGDLGLPATLAAIWDPACWERLSLTLSVDNLWNDQFQDLPGQRAADRSVFLSAGWTL